MPKIVTNRCLIDMIAQGHIERLNIIPQPIMRILFLGYCRKQTKLIDSLINAKCEVHHTDGAICTAIQYDLIVSFGYRHILKREFIESVGCPIVNNHMSYLPFNRGAHPNFWSFYESTPVGVSIHLMDEGIDTGPIIYQRQVVFETSEITFEQTYHRLFNELESLFIENLDQIISRQWLAVPQQGEGTLHYQKDLPEEFGGWQTIIEDEVRRLISISEEASLIKK